MLAALAVAAAAPAGGTAAGAAGGLYWAHAPASQAQLAVVAGRRLVIRVRAASSRRSARVHIGVDAPASATVSERDGNPATATVSIRGRRAGSVLSITFVARSAGSRPLRRTVYVNVRAVPASAYATRWAYVLDATRAFTRPTTRARAVAVVPTVTPDSLPNLVQVVAERWRRGRLVWVRVRLSTLPNSRLGWVPRAKLSTFHTVLTELVVDTRRFTITLYRRGRAVFHARVGVGTSSAPTPRGTFYIREKLTNFDNPFYGPIAFGTSARSPVLTDWPGGGIIGIHGTNEPGLIPGRISHGCIRLRNPDILRLARMLPLGTPLLVR